MRKISWYCLPVSSVLMKNLPNKKPDIYHKELDTSVHFPGVGFCAGSSVFSALRYLLLTEYKSITQTHFTFPTICQKNAICPQSRILLLFPVSESQESLLCGFEVTSQSAHSGFRLPDIIFVAWCALTFILGHWPSLFLQMWYNFFKKKWNRSVYCTTTFCFCSSVLNNYFFIKVSC